MTDAISIVDIGQAGGQIAVLAYLILKFGWIQKKDPVAEREREKREQEQSEKLESLDRTQQDQEKKFDSVIVSLEEVRNKTKDLHNWHNREDELGVKSWYVRRDLMEAQTKALEEVSAGNRELRDEVKAMTKSNDTLSSELRGLRTAIDKLSGSWARAGKHTRESMRTPP
jgi:hypothetical protein